MNRFLIPLALAALVAGCAMPGIFRQQSNEPTVADSAQTVVVREIYHETPVVYTDTVYLPAEIQSSEPVYVENEYNEYNETYVYVSEPPPPPHHRRPGWSQRQREQRPRDRYDDERSRERRGRPSEPGQPKVTLPPPAKKTYAPVTYDRRELPNKPTPPDQLVPPKRQSPAQGGSVPAAPVQLEAPKQAPTPPVYRPAVPVSDGVQVGMNQVSRK